MVTVHYLNVISHYIAIFRKEEKEEVPLIYIFEIILVNFYNIHFIFIIKYSVINKKTHAHFKLYQFALSLPSIIKAIYIYFILKLYNGSVLKECFFGISKFLFK